jgi:ribosomal protein L7Ae-like RNA K-turn-binding protein
MIINHLKLFAKERAEIVDHRVATTNDKKIPHRRVQKFHQLGESVGVDN